MSLLKRFLANGYGHGGHHNDRRYPRQNAVNLCPQCQAQLPPGARFCPRCGQPLQTSLALCRQCGGTLAPGSRFCPQCGQPGEAG